MLPQSMLSSPRTAGDARKTERRPPINENAGEAKGLSYSPSLRYESPRLSTPISKSKKLPIDITVPVR